MVKSLETLISQWLTRVHSERHGCIQKPYEAKIERGNTLATQISMKPSSGLYRSSMIKLNRHQSVGHLQNAPKHQYNPSL